MKARLALALLSLPALLVACQAGGEEAMVGTLERDRIEISVETDEPILSRYVRDGQDVTAGDLLMRQDPARVEARLAQATAQRDEAAARLAELQRGPRAEAIRETRARLAAARARAENARHEYLRVNGVFERGLTSEAALDNAEAAWDSAAAEAEAVREALEAQLEGTTAEELDQAAASLAAADARVAQARLDLERTELRAPAAGRVDKLLYQVGERPAPGATVAVLLDDSRVYARFYVPEHRRAAIQPGTELEARIDGVEQPFTGTVRWVSADASFTPYFALTEHDRSRLTYLAELDLPDASGLPSGVPLVVLPPQP